MTGVQTCALPIYTFVEKYQISWTYISGAIISVIFICSTYFANNIPLYKAWYWPNISWLAYWLDRRIGNHLEEISLLCFFIIVPVSCAYFINPHIKNLISKSARKTYGKDALISGLATLGAMFLYRPVQYRSEEHTSELQSRRNIVCRLLLEKKK